MADAFTDFPGDTAENTPFAGAYVPLRHYDSQDSRVAAIMIELRRDTYLRASNELASAQANDIVARLARLLDAIAGTAAT